jgi:DNA repair photolyase
MRPSAARSTRARGYTPGHLNIGSVTDAYQPAERRLRITRSVIEVLAEARHPFSIITKSSLVERDLDLIAPMASQRMAAVYLSITTLDPNWRASWNRAPAAPQRRLRTIEALARAGVPVGVSVSPVIPFLNEPELERILQAGARRRRHARLQHRAAPALGSEPAVPALAAAARARARGTHHGAGARHAWRPRQRQPFRHRA